MAQSQTTGAELREAGARPERAGTRMRTRVLTELARLTKQEELPREEALNALFPDTVLELPTLDVLVTSLLAGSHILVLGPPGSGKTTLAKDVWQLYPKEVYAVPDCPVHDDPFSLFDAAFARLVPACPYCKAKHGGVTTKSLGEFDPATVDPADVPVHRVRLREGYGLARVQGSPEVFPDNLTGTINLARLEEIGDPTSPLVLEPGKLLQAHRGLILIDEVGKLPRGTQNVLLQALQEGICSPAKSRETFPADLIAVTTSNLADLANLNEPLNDRLANVFTPFPTTAAANRRIVDKGLSGDEDQIAVPGPYREAAVHLMMTWRGKVEGGPDLSEVASNRALIDILRRTRSYAMLSADARIDPDDFRRGAVDAMSARIRARSQDAFDENTALVAQFVEKHWRIAAQRGATEYWCRFFVDELKEDKAEGARLVAAVREALLGAVSADQVRPLLRQQGGDARVRRFAQYVEQAEGVDRERVAEVLPAVFHALEEMGAFEGEKK